MTQTPDDPVQVLKPTGLERVQQAQSSGVSEPSDFQEHAMTTSSAGEKRKKLTPLKRLEQNITAIFKLGRTERHAKMAAREVQRLAGETDALRAQIGDVNNQLTGRLDAAQADIAARLDTAQADITMLHEAVSLLNERIERQGEMSRDVIAGRTAEIHRMTADLSRRIDLIAGLQPRKPDTDTATRRAEAEGMQAFLDSFYHNLENRFRGSTQEISKRLVVYRADVEAAVLRTGRKPVLDLGCGRGEWLALLKDWGLDASGVDLNAMQIEQARIDGLDVQLGDFQDTLCDAADNSLAVISAHHLIEHLPFNLVAWLVREATRVLAPGGLLLLETPDVRNVLVGATTFHNDPTHLQPRTFAVMGVLLESAGLHPIEQRRLNPHERLDEFIEKPTVDPEIGHLLFGPQDIAFLGYKPGASAA